MFASLPMYDLPEIQWATDQFWQAVAKRLGADIPLVRAKDWTAPWRNPALLFSQTCGYPYTHEFAGQLTYVATPHYDADGCDGPNYCSIVFAREKAALESFRSKTAVINNADSMSGMLALQLVFAPLAKDGIFFASAMESGGHFASMAAVQQGKADVCAIDCVTVALCRKHRPAALEGLIEITRSPSVPGLPYVTRAGDVKILQQVLKDVFADPAQRMQRDALLLRGVSILSADTYDQILRLEQELTVTSS
jgi:ABC-type phosphate/phosphonate transport system substrate-binding protein